MAKRPQNLPAFDKAQLEALDRRLEVIAPPETRRMIMASLNAAANPATETPEYGIASLPPDRRKIADSSVRETAAIFGFASNFEVPFDEQMAFNESLGETQNEDSKALEWAVVLALLAYFLFPRSEVKTLYDSILSAYVSAWQLAIKEQAARYGCNGAIVGNPPAASLATMKEWAKRDSDSIADTYDKDAENALRKLYDANPLGNIAYYINGMAQWANTRQLRKNLTIGINNVQAGYQLGLQDFHVNNQLKTKYAFSGAPPICPICVRLYGAGHVDYQTMATNSAPVHPNCPHFWVSVNTYQIPCSEIWTGV